ncbi:EXO5 [[Candida] subhashii]|uniref:Exonuclease V, mitochondrial n=1 Tax=[Candida] subhashii TaxID=561895 RepID=A0A8J5Q7F4_9ASCO|nr:EXO5 [[Candida] subhashii]KAG7662519.1 EXO5 [[Candida] subhashii]
MKLVIPKRFNHFKASMEALRKETSIKIERLVLEIPPTKTIPASSPSSSEVEIHHPEDIPTKPEDDQVRSLLRSMVKGTDPKQIDNPNVVALYDNWNLISNQKLPIINPTSISPYKFHSTHNMSRSYIDNPRLSVTKLLVSNWCELQEIYSIYSGSPRVTTKAMEAGTKTHLELETSIHKLVDLTSHIAYIQENCEELLERDDAESFWDRISMLLENSREGKLGVSWSDTIITRLFTLLTKSEAREILLHGYLNLDKREFIDNLEDLQCEGDITSKVLISGIVDHLKLQNIENPAETNLFDLINDVIDSELSETDESVLSSIDLTKFFIDMKSTLPGNSDGYELIMTDVKTRKTDSIPGDISVLKGAKLQTFYYRQLFELLSHDATFGYYSLIENAKRRHLDVDAPLDVLSVFKILRQSHPIILKDFLKLADGEPIGFAPYDEYQQAHEVDEYDFGLVFQARDEFQPHAPYNYTNFVERLQELDDEVDYNKILVPLLKIWKTPPTLRYLAARSSQFFNLFHDLIGDKTKIEYRNSKSGEIIKTLEYKYDPVLFKLEVANSCTLWTGKRNPKPADSLRKCDFCEYKSHCMIPNGGISSRDQKHFTGAKILEFLNDM